MNPIAVRPDQPQWVLDALARAGVQPTDDPTVAEGLIWLGFQASGGAWVATRTALGAVAACGCR